MSDNRKEEVDTIQASFNLVIQQACSALERVEGEIREFDRLTRLMVEGPARNTLLRFSQDRLGMIEALRDQLSKCRLPSLYEWEDIQRMPVFFDMSHFLPEEQKALGAKYLATRPEFVGELPEGMRAALDIYDKTPFNPEDNEERDD